jgi:RNA polymerase sigma-70 factor, ECF subfamily
LRDINEKELIYRIKNKDIQSFAKLVNDFGKLVYYVAGNILKEDYEKDFIDECYNDVFTTIWFNIDCFDEEKGNFKNWLISITKYKAIDIKRKNFKNNNYAEYTDEITALEDKTLEKIEDEEIIDNILNNLEEKDKVIFIKRYIEGYTIKEIAKELGYSENYIHTRISRTRKKLKNIKEEVI